MLNRQIFFLLDNLLDLKVRKQKTSSTRAKDNKKKELIEAQTELKSFEYQFIIISS